ncbi:leucine-rich repeat domain-containing protein [Bernardetia sp.]|uniref:leucine-rich repeat domain-containing protein n=1 Tax=Bernardetia sp. TaxID=1937974 RepID=UPI0025C05ECA|nr:leucine-rich repeat domain-containing protein [Bernardetia sp.]
MDSDYEEKLVNIENNVQDETSLAWKKLCEYVEKVAEEGIEEFHPYKYLGKELYSQIYTLPKTIAKLKKVKKIWLYGSKLKRIPPEIGEMESLKGFYPYTSYDLHWFPYEIINCKKIRDSTISTRALYGNYNYRRPFPDLTNNPVRYDSEIINCSVCKKKIKQEKTNQLWISLWIGKDVLPLLVNSCSDECTNSLPKPASAYVSYPHKGGMNLKQPAKEDYYEHFKKVNWKEVKNEIANRRYGN